MATESVFNQQYMYESLKPHTGEGYLQVPHAINYEGVMVRPVDSLLYVSLLYKQLLRKALQVFLAAYLAERH